MGFILALGMLVDDAVVVARRVHGPAARLRPARGGHRGAQHVLVPVTFGVITTVVAFLPVLFATGAIGQAYGVMAATVICCLVFSLIECQTVLPPTSAMAASGCRSGFRTDLPRGSRRRRHGRRAGCAFRDCARGGGCGTGHCRPLRRRLAQAGCRICAAAVRFESGLRWVIDNPFRRAPKAPRTGGW